MKLTNDEMRRLYQWQTARSRAGRAECLSEEAITRVAEGELSQSEREAIVDLVALSACRTALGKEIKGEGLVGLTRGFMYAGAARVVASMWDVKDEATAELMKRFYQGMFKEGLRPAEALRAAQVSMWKEPRWNSPYYWAGFALQGEWK